MDDFRPTMEDLAWVTVPTNEKRLRQHRNRYQMCCSCNWIFFLLHAWSSNILLTSCCRPYNWWEVLWNCVYKLNALNQPEAKDMQRVNNILATLSRQSGTLLYKWWLTEDPKLDLVCGHASDAVAGGADVGAGVLLQDVGQAKHGTLWHRRLGQTHHGRPARVVAALE